MDITLQIGEYLAKHAGCQYEVFTYMRFGAIVRMSLTDNEGDDWVLSFSECRSVSFRSGSGPLHLQHVVLDDGYIGISDEAVGFHIVCRECFLIHDDEYLA